MAFVTGRRSEPSEFEKSILKIIKPTNNNEGDGINGFLMEVGEVLRKLPYGKRRKLQRDISDLIFRYETECGLIDDENS